MLQQNFIDECQRQLGAEGQFAKQAQSFSVREAQCLMTEAIARAMVNRKHLVVEAGTGTGKTFAYLVPALLSKKKIIISTATKNLQDQLFNKDIPYVCDTLKHRPKVAVLKGRSNYICIERTLNYAEDGRFRDPKLVTEFQSITRVLDRMQHGDIAELISIPENSMIWPYVTSTADNCLQSECEHLKKCFVAHARRRAIDADITIINHHVFFADWVLKQGGFGEILPQADLIIFDEAHALPDIASHFLGEHLSSRQINEWCRDTAQALQQLNHEDNEFFISLKKLNELIEALHLHLGKPGDKNAWTAVIHNPKIKTNCALIVSLIEDLLTRLSPLAPQSKTLEHCKQRGAELKIRFEQLTGGGAEEQIHWFELFKYSFAIHQTPLNISEVLGKLFNQQPCPSIFTSATLTVDQQFSFYVDQLGLNDFESLALPSPFDHRKQAKLYIPRTMPLPSDPLHTDKLIETAIPLIQLIGGKTFMLFTSLRALKRAFELLHTRIPYPLLVQGQMPKEQLLAQFRAAGNAVLLASMSFWEGVDVKGEALSCVIIDKLPFAMMDDPVLKARINAMRKRGQDPFKDYQLNEAIIRLKQGIGRLIRDASDRGVVMIADPRIIKSSYGKSFLNSIPPMTITQNFEDVAAFWQETLRENNRETVST